MATIGGAETLGASAAIGSLEAGKKADLVVVDLDCGNYGPVYDIYSHLVYAAHGEMVKATMVNGRWLMLDGKLMTLDESRLRRIVSRYAREVRSTANAQ
jgi:5-methylthioadenosine/S-adenosylhomocysteine deaminase